MPARRSQPILAATGVLCELGIVLRPNALRIVFGLLLGILAAVVIGTLAPPTSPPKTIAPSTAFSFRFSPAPPDWTITR
jgi:hypothetical protein